MPSEKRGSTREFFINLARAYGGAVLFLFPILMTMEMWWLGAYLDGTRLALWVIKSHNRNKVK